MALVDNLRGDILSIGGVHSCYISSQSVKVFYVIGHSILLDRLQGSARDALLVVCLTGQRSAAGRYLEKGLLDCDPQLWKELPTS